MLKTPAVMIVVTGAAFLAAGLAPVALESRERPVQAGVSSKGNRLPSPADVGQRASVSTVEVIGLNQATVVFKDRDGRVLYRSDPLSNTTIVARNADLPVVTLKDEPTSVVTPVVQQPAPKREGSETPDAQPRKPRQIGCEAPVSPLTRSEASRTPSLCLASLPTAARS